MLYCKIGCIEVEILWSNHGQRAPLLIYTWWSVLLQNVAFLPQMRVLDYMWTNFFIGCWWIWRYTTPGKAEKIRKFWQPMRRLQVTLSWYDASCLHEPSCSFPISAASEPSSWGFAKAAFPSIRLLRHVVKDCFCVFLYSAVFVCVHVETGQKNDYELGRSWESKERADTIASAILFASTTTKSITIPRGSAWRFRLTFGIENNHTSVKYQLQQLLSCFIIAFPSKHQETPRSKSDLF